MILLLLALHCADDFHLRYAAQQAGVDARRTVAIARVETACNLNPRLRAHDCGRQTSAVQTKDTVRAPQVRGFARNRRDCEVGRFQIRPSTGRRRCPGEDIRAYRGNVACHLRMFAADVDRYGLTDATVRHNGYGPAGAYEFLYKVLRVEEGL